MATTKCGYFQKSNMTIEEKIENIINEYDFKNGNRIELISKLQKIFFNNRNKYEFEDILYNITDSLDYCKLYNFRIRFLEMCGHEGEDLEQHKARLLTLFIFEFYNNNKKIDNSIDFVKYRIKGNEYF